MSCWYLAQLIISCNKEVKSYRKSLGRQMCGTNKYKTYTCMIVVVLYEL